jgi:hypothetical protein
MSKPVRQKPGKRPKPQELREKPKATDNRCLPHQIRKILGEHYASKYRVR